MSRTPALLAAIVLLATPALAQVGRTDVEDLRPKNMQYPDNLGMEDLPIGPVPKEFLQQGPSDATGISTQIFGDDVDAAYGAYQRGYYLTALELALPRAEAADAHAQTLIAEIYAGGLGVPEDMSKAASWYRLASKNGDPIATFELAMMYLDGRGVEQDRKRAAELFTDAAAKGNLMAKYNLGLLHVEGIYAEPNLIRAAELIKEAADAGIAEARYDYAGMLIEGAGVAPNPAAAAEQFRLAADEGFAPAQVEYATMLYLGRGIPADRAAAALWYGRAAEAGNPVAQSRYAKLLAAGEGIAADPESAAMYRALARRQGLKDDRLDAMLQGLPADLVERAEERARFWPSAPPAQVAEAETAGDAPAAN